VPGHDRLADGRQFALDEVQVRAAHAASFYTHTNFSFPGFRHRDFLQLQRVALDRPRCV